MSYGTITPATRVLVASDGGLSFEGQDATNDVLKVEPYCGAAYAILGANGTAACNQQAWYFTGGTYPTSGSFKVVWGGQTTASVAYNATAATLQAALIALSSIGDGEVSVSGGPANTAPFQVTFLGSLAMAGAALTPTFDETNGGSGGLNAGVLVATPLFKNGAGAFFGLTVGETAAGAITVYDGLIDTAAKLAVIKTSVAEGDYLTGGFRFSTGLMIVGAAASKITVRSR